MQISCEMTVLMLMTLIAVTPFNCIFDAMIDSKFLYTSTILTNMTTTQIPKMINQMTITMINMFDHDMFLFFDLNADGFFLIKNSSFTTLNNNDFTQYAFLIGWAGRIGVSPNLNSNANKIEASYTESFDLNVSYVDDYSVLITCFFDDISITDCNIDFFKQSKIQCDDEIERFICLNPF